MKLTAYAFATAILGIAATITHSKFYTGAWMALVYVTAFEVFGPTVWKWVKQTVQPRQGN
jgi:hypothetical protein